MVWKNAEIPLYGVIPYYGKMYTVIYREEQNEGSTVTQSGVVEE